MQLTITVHYNGAIIGWFIHVNGLFRPLTIVMCSIRLSGRLDYNRKYTELHKYDIRRFIDKK